MRYSCPGSLFGRLGCIGMKMWSGRRRPRAQRACVRTHARGSVSVLARCLAGLRWGLGLGWGVLWRGAGAVLESERGAELMLHSGRPGTRA